MIPAAGFVSVGHDHSAAAVPRLGQPILRWLPFAGLVDLPFRVYTGHIPPAEVTMVLARQLIWTALLVLFGRWLLGRGMKRDRRAGRMRRYERASTLLSIRFDLAARPASVSRVIPACSRSGIFLITGIEFLGIWALFDRFGQVRGWTLPQVALFYGMISITLAISDAIGRGFRSVRH